MKRYLTAIFIGISGVVLIIGLGVDLYWSGIASWGIAFICLIFAVYFTKYIPNDKNDEKH
ncbi:hypothetical protein [Lentibacillus amyloliquefaciens]|uniref:Uncharacterized protein n=1 Tax=Lentibacillus amyloliquefaciens TaxID=1472767 RepID=A0A0U3W7P0_9BACI|nr:hypothetical protein [Lentibacillus amyloliquefaciens]ALX49168.1 hypothetical protein AOX59_11570 [Lentibacillus amyloliquefaciens]